MFNSTNFLKAAGAFLSAFLFYLLSSWAASALFAVGGGHDSGHEGEDHAEVAMMTDAPGDLLAVADDTAEAEDEGPQIALGTGDAAKGEKVFNKCKACHKMDGSNGTGPHLDGVVNRAIGGVDGFAYSDAMAGHGGTWDYAALDAWLEKPKDFIPGNKMSFAGLRKPEDRNDLIAYLESVQ
ncbi:hypothetical protein BFP70_00490 [Thioclava sp. SK-1]|uniref:c-type cytochrome n=1 Tax=Thioclava sp. SK-1 TaxID=1889770 RepID=UPI00082557F6|nr:cytochrome c family protein [Thioclava sp. SK-1]OCX66676.1 hypothetical protein BFP70_00490 [Thioclava sp. SK-1]